MSTTTQLLSPADEEDADDDAMPPPGEPGLVPYWAAGAIAALLVFAWVGLRSL